MARDPIDGEMPLEVGVLFQLCVLALTQFSAPSLTFSVVPCHQDEIAGTELGK